MAFSGKFVLRISPTLHRKLHERAAREGISLNRLCEDLLTAAMKPEIGGARDAHAALIAAIEKTYPRRVHAVVAFGSMARGEAGESSDLDLLIVVEGAPERAMYAAWEDSIAVHEACRGYGREVSPQFVSLPASADSVGGIWFEAALDGIVLWSRDGRVPTLLAEIRGMIAEGKVARAVTHGHSYWVRKTG